MGGGLMQLVAYGSQDIYLTGNPQITFFKVVYRRHTNFSVEPIQQVFNGIANWGQSVTATIARNGDLLHRMYITATIPSVPSNGNDQFRWLNWLGHILIQQAEIEIGGQRIDRHYGHWLHIWNELTQTFGHQAGYATMVGNVPRLVQSTIDNTPSITIYVPLRFWFNRNVGLALPLIALQYHDVKLNLQLSNVQDCYWSSGSGRVPGDLKNVKLWVDYIYLDTDERRRFAQASHEYLIEQLQFNGDTPIISTTEQLKMAFNHPVKEVIWTVQKDSLINPSLMTDYGGQQWFNFTDSIDYTYFSGTPQDPLGGGIGTAAFNSGNWYSSLPMSGTANGSVATAGQYGQTTSNISGLFFDDLFGTTSNVSSRAWNSHLPVFDSGENPTAIAKIQLNGHDRLSEREGRYFNTVIPQECHENCPATGINVYSFAFKPEEHQPSGTCNFSRVDIAQLLLTITNNTYTSPVTQGNTDTAKCRIYATNYNVLRVLSGMAGLAFTN
uniref:Major capsid protein N-terminal domain-containing protein n=1 Tax=viral metagenome TaxID=1070528 RepID=A0A6C0F3A6_9ZZZZ